MQYSTAQHIYTYICMPTDLTARVEFQSQFPALLLQPNTAIDRDDKDDRRSDSLSMSQLDIIVVGAGLGGLAAAIQCALAGHQVVVLEGMRGMGEVCVCSA